MAGFRESLKDAVRQMAYRTSLDSLKKRGVQQVNVLGIDRIVALVETAVHKVLKSRLVGIEREAVADATKAEFLRLLRSNEDLQREKSELERQVERAEEEVDQLRRTLAMQQQELQLKIEEGQKARGRRYDGEDAAIAGQVAEVVRALAAQGSASTGDLEGRVMELVMDVVSRERKAADVARAALHDRDVDLLQRRVAKLSETLGQTERRLQEVAAQKHLDGGISSIYREVQGLSPHDAQVEKKKDLMAAIFQANLALQKKTGA